MRIFATAPVMALLVSITMATGCGTLPNGREWGQDATLFPGGDRIARAARNAATDPLTWAPAAGALAFGSSSMDGNLADWASGNTPLFGSPWEAARASDDLNAAAVAAAYITGALIPSGNAAKDILMNKTRGYLVGASAVTLTKSVTGILKTGVGRRRPSGADRQSFPSGHSSSAFAHASLAMLHTDSISIPANARYIMDFGFLAIASGCGWARLEAGAHYPSDVLAAAALGNFISVFIYDALWGWTQMLRPS